MSIDTSEAQRLKAEFESSYAYALERRFNDLMQVHGELKDQYDALEADHERLKSKIRKYIAALRDVDKPQTLQLVIHHFQRILDDEQ